MATSGSIDLVATRNNLITEAMEQLGVLAEGDSPNANQLTVGGRTLNYMVKAWQNKATNLFAIQRLYVYLEASKREYSLGPSGDQFTTEDPLSNYTQLSAASAATDTTLTVDAIGTAADADTILIQLDDGTLHKDTINGAPSGSTITITTGVASAASIDNYVYWYTTKGNRPRKISHAQLVANPGNGSENWIDVISRQEYAELSEKGETGQVNQIYYDPQISTGKLFVWPVTNDVTDYLRLYVERTLHDFDADDDADFPQEWYFALSLNLAVALGPKYGVSSETFNQLKNLAQEALFDALSGDTEDYMLIQPDYNHGGRYY